MLLLRRLPRKHRTVLLLRVCWGLSAEETGQQLGLTPGHVRLVQYLALTRLRVLLSDEEAVQTGVSSAALRKR